MKAKVIGLVVVLLLLLLFFISSWIFGYRFLDWFSLVVAAVLAWLVHKSSSTKIDQLQKRLDVLESTLSTNAQTVSQQEKIVDPQITRSEFAAKVTEQPGDLASVQLRAPPPSSLPPMPPAPPIALPTAMPTALQKPPLKVPPVKPTGPSVFDLAKNWFFGGNTVARFGLIILFLGLSFLAKYAIDNALFPIEARLAVIGIIAIGLLGFGWRLRDSRTSYALLLQGGAVATLYLEVFAAFKFYQLISSPLAFGLMILICVLATFLALRQDALRLAVIATVGGFMTPILASTGAGNHVALFSIYAVLNFGIFAIARFKPWRVLYLLGFVFTFGVTGMWLMSRYQPELLPSTLGFVLLFIALYSLIPVLDARRATPNIKHYVDGSLVFGTPTVGFGLLSVVLGHIQYGLAFAALGLGAWYICLAALGLKKQVAKAVTLDAKATSVRGLQSAFISYVGLGAGFASLAIPLALEPRLAGIAWAVEGAALIWLGMRTDQVFTRFAGVALQAFGLVLYVSRGFNTYEMPVFLNPFWLGATMLAAAGYWSGWFYHRWATKRKSTSVVKEQADVQSEKLFNAALSTPAPAATAVPSRSLADKFAAQWISLEIYLPSIFPIIASTLIVFSNSNEVERLPILGSGIFAALLGLWTLLAGVHAFAGRRLQWPVLLWSAMLLLPVMAIANMAQWIGFSATFEAYRWVAWPIALLVMTWILYQQAINVNASTLVNSEEPSPKNNRSLWVASFAVLTWVTVTLALQLVQWQTMLYVKDFAWAIAAVGVVLSLIILMVLRVDWSTKLGAGAGSVMAQFFARSLKGAAPMGLAWLLGLWFIFACTSDYGGVAIRPFIPLLNPVDLSAAFALLTLISYTRSEAFKKGGASTQLVSPQNVQIALAGAGFLLLNTLLMRALSYYLEIDYRVGAMLDSSTAQTSFSLLWAITATIIMFISTKKISRQGWLVGAGLLGVVVLKLFLIDLSSISTLTRIISFVGVGLLMLLIGYLSPLPPTAQNVAQNAPQKAP